MQEMPFQHLEYQKFLGAGPPNPHQRGIPLLYPPRVGPLGPAPAAVGEPFRITMIYKNQ